MKLRISALVICALIATTLVFMPQRAQSGNKVIIAQQSVPEKRDGQHDFDWEVGKWNIHLKRLAQRLKGSHEWVEFDGTADCHKVWDGRAQLDEFNVDNPEKHQHIQGFAVRTYNQQSHQWSIYWANAENGVIDFPPMVGEFKNGRGEFYDQEIFEGRAIYVRFIWENVNGNSPHFEQAFSIDGGKTWETNWITDQTRQKP